MDSEIWDLLSPRYFSDFFIWLFNGGPWSIILIIILLFFGTVIWPILVRISVFVVKKINGRFPGTLERINRLGLKEEKIPKWIPGESRFYWIIFSLSGIFSFFYLVGHMCIRANPARVLTTGGNLQWLPADEFQTLVRFLYQWVLTGYALAVLSLSWGLDSMARWMKESRAATASSETGSGASTTSEGTSPGVEERIASALQDAERIIQLVVFSKPVYLLKAFDSSGGKPRLSAVEERMLEGDQELILDDRGLFNTESGDSPPVLQFKNKAGELQITITTLDNPDITGLEFRTTSNDNWQELPSSYVVESEWLEIRIQKGATTYYHCTCERYVKS